MADLLRGVKTLQPFASVLDVHLVEVSALQELLILYTINIYPHSQGLQQLVLACMQSCAFRLYWSAFLDDTCPVSKFKSYKMCRCFCQ